MAEKRNELETALAAVGVGVLVLIAVGLAPGVFVVGWANQLLHTGWDTGQLWAFAVVAAAVLFGFCCAVTRDLEKGTNIYSIVALGTILIALFCHFGLKIEFPAYVIHLYFPS